MNQLSALLIFSFLLAVSVSGRNFSPDPALESAAGAWDFLLPPSDTAEPPAEYSGRGLGVFDVNDYGAAADGKTENSLAFMAAWEDACGYRGSSTLLIPEGSFFLAPVSFSGPCFNDLSPKVLILGTLIAPATLAADVWIRFKSLRHLTLTGGNGSAILDGRGSKTWSSRSACEDSSSCNISTTSLKLSDVSNGTVSNISLVDSKGFHVSLHGCDNVHISGFNIRAPWDSPNTDGIHISHSTNINITASDIGVGDDCISIGPGSVNVSVSDVRCGPGHGISVGSLGKYKKEKDVRNITVKNCTLVSTDNGLRIKTWPDSPPSAASGILFQDINMINVKNPIIINQEYGCSTTCNKPPSRVQINDVHFNNVNGSSISPVAVQLICSKQFPCQNIEMFDINLKYTGPPKDLPFSASCSNAKVGYKGIQFPPPCK